MANLAVTYSNQRQRKEAEKFNLQVLEISERTLGAEHPDTLTMMANLAVYIQRSRTMKRG